MVLLLAEVQGSVVSSKHQKQGTPTTKHRRGHLDCVSLTDCVFGEILLLSGI